MSVSAYKCLSSNGKRQDCDVLVLLKYAHLARVSQEHGLDKSAVKLPKATMQHIVAGYTRESGVRGLEKQIAKVVRHYAMLQAKETPRASKLLREELEAILGPAKMLRDTYENNNVARRPNQSIIITFANWT